MWMLCGRTVPWEIGVNNNRQSRRSGGICMQGMEGRPESWRFLAGHTHKFVTRYYQTIFHGDVAARVWCGHSILYETHKFILLSLYLRIGFTDLSDEHSVDGRSERRGNYESYCMGAWKFRVFMFWEVRTDGTCFFIFFSLCLCTVP